MARPLRSFSLSLQARYWTMVAIAIGLFSLVIALAYHTIAAQTETMRAAYAGQRGIQRLPLTLLAGAETALHEVNGRGVETAKGSGMQQLGIAEGFGAITGSDTYGVGKPSPEPLRRTLQVLGVAPSEAIFFGDTHADAACAQAAARPRPWCRRRGSATWRPMG